MCVYACVCMHVGTYGGTLKHTYTHTHPLPTPARAGEPQITKNAKKLEQIKIIQFCLKIWDLCTFLHIL